MSKFSRAFCTVAGAALLAGLTMGAASAQDTAPSAYLGIGGGLNWVPDIDFASGRSVETDMGWAAVGTLGYRWGNGLRTELEGGYRQNDATFHTFTGLTPTTVGGKVKAESILVNLLYDFNTGSRFVPYLGAGVGVARPTFEFATSERDYVVAYQGIAGASLRFSDAVEVFADYRYLGTGGMDLTLSGWANSDDYSAHTVLAGLRWTFWSGAAAAPAPVAAAPAPVAATPKDYTIYFEFDRANITDAAGAVLDEIKSNTTPAQSVAVRGHADTSGSDDYNQGLSDRRAKNTAAGLTSRGVGVGSVTGAGEAEPAVPTPDGVKEPLNRRSVIKIQGAGM